jgi:hypothetical protein
MVKRTDVNWHYFSQATFRDRRPDLAFTTVRIFFSEVSESLPAS